MVSEPPYTVETYKHRDAWLKGRGNGIGASEVAVILGVSKWSSPYALWKRKRGITSPEETSEEARWGWLMEPAIGNWFQEDTGWRVKFDGLRVLRSKSHPFISCSLDGLVVPGLAGIEIPGVPFIIHEECPIDFKNCHFRVAGEWKDNPPLAHQCQLQTQMFVTGAPLAFIAVCVGGCEGRWFPILRNDQFIRRMLYKVVEFWKSVQDGVEPPVDGHEKTRLAITEEFSPPTNGKRIELPEEALHWVNQFDGMKQAKKFAEEGFETAANHIRRYMEDAEIAECPGGSGFVWKENKGGTRSLRRVDKVPRDLSEVLE